MKKRLITVLLTLGCSFCIGLAGCAGNAPDPDTREEQVEEDRDTDKDEDDEMDENEDEDRPSEIAVTHLDYSSSDSILEFLTGEWTFVDPSSGIEYARFWIRDDGVCKFGDFETAQMCSGTILFDEYLDDNFPGVHRYEISLDGLEEAFGYSEDTSTSSGRFMIAQAAGKDYLYLEEIGNGGSTLAYDVFAAPSGDDDFMMKWILVRNNNVTHEEHLQKNANFYARVIENTDEGLLVQRLDDVSFVTYQEYTNFKFLAAYFDESNNQQACLCSINEDADISGVLDLSELDKAYPSTVYKIYTDSEGNIEEMHDVEDAYYGRYEINSLEQEVSFEFNTFTINGWELDPADYGIDGNAILDLEVFGEDLIITSHLNPHMDVYTVFDMRNAWPEHEIYGANFIHGDKVWDSFYSYMDTVYDYEDHPIYTVDGTEICGLSFSEDGTQITIEYWKDDYIEIYEETIDRPECVNAPHYAYADYARHRTAENWNEFMSYAPDDALFMVMVNPHSDDAWDFNLPMNVGEGSDNVYVVSLQNGTEFTIGDTKPEIRDKGEIVSYWVTVPEGAPMYTLHAETPDGRSAEWDVTWISGKDDTRWIYK
ncbi:MAG: hypothetical protein J6X94_01700 [Lachnospiraceae bacterium]|nr:hypothetical protein [Lachnospiraceae bacterium]